MKKRKLAEAEVIIMCASVAIRFTIIIINESAKLIREYTKLNSRNQDNLYLVY